MVGPFNHWPPTEDGGAIRSASRWEQVCAEHTAHAEPVRQPCGLVHPVASGPVMIHFLEPDDIGHAVLDHGRDALEIDYAVVPEPVPDVPCHCAHGVAHLRRSP